MKKELNESVDSEVKVGDNVITDEGLKEDSLESIEDTVDDIIENITTQVKRLDAVKAVQESKAKKLAEEIKATKAKQKLALNEQKKALRIANKLNKLIA